MFARVVRSNNFTIFLSVLLAIILWLFVVGDNLFQVLPKNKELETVSLVYINLDENMKVSELPRTVSVSLKGMPEDLKDIDDSNLLAYVDLKEKGPGDYRVEVKLNPPEGLSITSFHPAKVEVTIEEK